ncbi:MAG: YhcH/YjgK/YiaL family protein [Armatimonadetes bacterium]|nr:YhcH/YjgK/YiaL family protein [Armatimonadota bacterium]
MIVDNISNAGLYFGLGKGIESGLKFLQTQDISKLGLGKHVIDGDDCFALVMEYDSKPVEQGIWEAHRRYIDIQFVVKGTERIGYANIGDLAVSKEYDEANDGVLFTGEGDSVTLSSGAFAIYYPHDGHMPSLAVDKPARVRKVVVKVKA